MTFRDYEYSVAVWLDAAYAQVLLVSVILKKMKMQDVSDMAMQFAVAALWRLCKNFKADWMQG